MNEPVREHIMLTVLGISTQAATYSLNDRRATAKVAPAALYELLPPTSRPSRILALCTPEAEKKSLPELKASLQGQPCEIEVASIRSEPSDDAIHACLAQLTRSIPSGADLTVDVTHGFRHLAFIVYVGVLYLTALREVRLRDAYYGLLNSNESQESSFLTVRPLIELPQWFYAVRVFKETGSAQAMADLVADSAEQESEQVGTALRTLSEAYASALPIEFGYLAHQFLAKHAKALGTILHKQRLPLADELVKDVTGFLEQKQLTRYMSGSEWKTRIPLDPAELKRQAGIIDDFLKRRDYRTALGLMREWLTLWAMWCIDRKGNWLDFRDRPRFAGDPQRAENADIRTAARLIPRLRNAYAHHGLDQRVWLSVNNTMKDDIEAVERAWKILRDVPKLSLDFPLPKEQLLISPLGTRPGVLFSALSVADPHRIARCLVICSAATEGAVAEACQAAGYTGEVTLLRLADPFGGVSEIDDRVREAEPFLCDAGQVLVNATGGTTLMGVLADRIATEARRLRRSVHRFVLIDRRPAADQETDPYQQGEVCWLDDPPGEDDEA